MTVDTVSEYTSKSEHPMIKACDFDFILGRSVGWSVAETGRKEYGILHTESVSILIEFFRSIVSRQLSHQISPGGPM